MKVAVVTVCENWGNYGAFLQMYSMVKCLEQLGCEVYCVLPPKGERNFQNNCKKYKDNYIISENDSLKLLRKIWRKYRICENYFVNLYNYYKYHALCKDINFVDIEKAKACDFLILGSDEIWNVRNESLDSPFYYGCDFTGMKKIAYAICSGEASVSDYEKRGYPISAIRKIDYLSARDMRTKKLIEQVSNKECAYVVDPTFLVDKSMLEQCSLKLQDKYIIIYAWEVPEQLAQYIVRFSREKHLKIVCAMGLRKYDFADININISPKAFANAFAGAEYVFAATFHGCVFSIIEKKRGIFAATNVKIKDLIGQFEMENRIYTSDLSYDEFVSIMENDVNDSKIDELIKQKRNESLSYLKQAIGVK